MRAPQEILDWLQGGWHASQYCKTYDGMTGIDTDGMYGFQCVDFVNGYLDFMVGSMLTGNAIDLWTTPLPSTIERLENTPDFVPQLGDIFIAGKPYGYNANNRVYYGHTGVVLDANLDTFRAAEQNWVHPNPFTGSPPTEEIHNYSSVLGFLRPKGDEMATEQDITNAYRGMFHRDPDPAGLATYADKSVSDMLQQLITSPEMDSVNKRWASMMPDYSADRAKLEDIKKTIDTIEGDLK